MGRLLPEDKKLIREVILKERLKRNTQIRHIACQIAY